MQQGQFRNRILQAIAEWLQGYEFDYDKQCVVVRKRTTKAIDYCRPLIDCNSMCKDVTQIDSLPAMNMTMELFSQVRTQILQGV